MSVHFTPGALAAVRAHGEASYPEEGCGLLLGTFAGSHRRVSAALRLNNAAPAETRRTRFAFDPAEHLAAQRAARERGLEVVGFYHSHPDHPAAPSPTDLALASWPGYSYVIVSVLSGRAADLNSFELAADRSRFEAERLELDGDAVPAAAAGRETTCP